MRPVIYECEGLVAAIVHSISSVRVENSTTRVSTHWEAVTSQNAHVYIKQVFVGTATSVLRIFSCFFVLQIPAFLGVAYLLTLNRVRLLLIHLCYIAFYAIFD